MGGLTAGAALAKKGARVLVLERHYAVGANASIFRRRGFEFDIGGHYVGDTVPGGIVDRILRDVGVEDFRFLPLNPEAVDILRFPGREVRMPVGYDRFAQRLRAVSGVDQEGIQEWLTLCSDLLQLQRQQVVEGSGASALTPTIRKWAGATLKEFLEQRIQNRMLRSILAAQHLNYALPPSRVSVLLPAGMMAQYLAGAGYPTGGGGALSERLAQRIEASGGQILLLASVQNILRESGAAVGVELLHKHLGRREVFAPVVISNADPFENRRLLGEGQSPTGDSRLMAGSISVLYLGVKKHVPSLDVGPSNIWLFSTLDHETAYQAAAEGRIEGEATPIFVSLSTHKDPSHARFAPEGVMNVQAMVLSPGSPAAWGVPLDAVSTGTYRDSPEYVDAKAKLTDTLLRRLTAHFPGLRENVVFSELATPLTHARYTRSTSGTPYGLAFVPPGQKPVRLPFVSPDCKGLYFCGASTEFGPGITCAMMSGHRVARLARL